MTLEIIPPALVICQLPSAEGVDLRRPFTFLSVTDGEISLVCPEEALPPGALHTERGYRCLRVQGVLDFSLTGILAGLSSLLARHGIPIFALSTWNTDYLLIHQAHFPRALSLLKEAGHRIVP